MNEYVLLTVWAAVVTMTSPLVAPAGTVTVKEVSVQFDIAAAGVPLNVTEPAAAPKPIPLTTTLLPGAAWEGAMLLIVGEGVPGAPAGGVLPSVSDETAPASF